MSGKLFSYAKCFYHKNDNSARSNMSKWSTLIVSSYLSGRTRNVSPNYPVQVVFCCRLTIVPSRIKSLGLVLIIINNRIETQTHARHKRTQRHHTHLTGKYHNYWHGLIQKPSTRSFYKLNLCLDLLSW